MPSAFRAVRLVVFVAGFASASSAMPEIVEDAISALNSNSTAAILAADVVDMARGIALQASETPLRVSGVAIAILALFVFLSWYYKPLFWTRKQEDVRRSPCFLARPSLFSRRYFLVRFCIR